MDPGDAGVVPDRVAEDLVSRATALAVVLGASLGLTTGCGENCSSTCFRAYDETQCDVDTSGQTREDAINACIADCRFALGQVGPMGNYNPLSSGSLTQVELENERQAAAWMDCIADATCEQLQAGQCNPL